MLFHLGNTFAFQVKFGLHNHSLASFGISPLLFHDYGYGIHLFYPPLAHFLPALIAFLLTKVGIYSTLLAIRLFSFLTLFFSGISIFYVAKKNHRTLNLCCLCQFVVSFCALPPHGLLLEGRFELQPLFCISADFIIKPVLFH